MAKLKPYIITLFTILITLGIHLYQSNLSKYAHLQDQINQSSQSTNLPVISADIHGSVLNKKPLSVNIHKINLKNIKVKFIKNYYKYKDQEINYNAYDMLGEGWISQNTNSFAFESNFHNTAFDLEDEKQTDEIMHLFSTGDIKIKIYVQDDPNIYSDQLFDVPALITINNVTRGEIIKLKFNFEENRVKISGSTNFNLNNYNLELPSSNKIYEFINDISVNFEAETL